MENSNSNDAFAAFVRKAEEDEAKAQNKSSGNFSGGSYEQQTWCGLETNQPHIVRLVGNPPESMTPGFKAGPTDAHELYIETIKDDNGKRMSLRLPPHAEDITDEHIMWRIINRVKEVEWKDDPANPGKRIKCYKNEKSLVFDKVTHGGFNANDPAEANSYRYSRGWGGQQVCIMNVIDREDDWCATNKHTKLLSKRVTYKDGNIWPTIGVPSYGFMSALQKLTKVYGNWSHYDIQIVKTGQMNTPYELKNASYYKSAGVPEIDQSKLNVISTAPDLTAEEQAYERYDIEKLYHVTSYRSLRDRLGVTIKEIDSTLHTHFYEELESLAAREEAEYAEKKAQEAPTQPVQESVAQPAVAAPVTPVQPVQAAPTTPVAPAQPTMAVRGTRATAAATTSALAPTKIAALKGYAKLTDANKAQIADVILNQDGTVDNVLYTADAAAQCACEECGKPSPSDFLSCPVCGCDFV